MTDDGGQLAPRIALVTGANKGIGLAIAKGIGALGYEVLVGSRDRARGQAATDALCRGGVHAHLAVLDITKEADIQRAAAWIDERFGCLDALVNNAAIKLEWHPSPPSEVSLSLVRQTFETNVFGTMAVIQGLLPLLRTAGAGRIVNLSSGLGSLGLSTTDGTKYRDRPLLSYNVAKAAVNSLTVQFANELRGTSIKVNAVDPGYTNTDMTLGTGTRTPADAAGVVVRLATLSDDGPTGGFFDERGPVPW
jgi:NAD(P)-dependent dehydrogenase (short-subunit alcohol dehydrogenase family)